MNKPVFIVVTLICCVLLSPGCEREQEGRFTTLDSDDQSTHRSNDPVIRLMDSNRVKAVIRAKLARVYEDKLETYLDSNVTVEFMSMETGHRVSILTADSVMIDERTNDMTATGNVVVIADSSFTTLKTELLMWNNKRRILHSTEFVHIKSPNEEIQGYGFESDQYLKNYVIYKVRGRSY